MKSMYLLAAGHMFAALLYISLAQLNSVLLFVTVCD